MQNHSDNNLRIIAYLSYLRDISRKIISRTGFDKCLLNKVTNSVVKINDLQFQYINGEGIYNELNDFHVYLQKYNDKKLFIGFGSIIGTSKKVYAGPILTIQCEILKEEETQIIKIEPDLSSLSINYDLVSALSINYQNEEDDLKYTISEDENKTLENIENSLENIKVFEYQILNKLVLDTFNELKNKIDHFQQIEVKSSDGFDLIKETKIFTFRPTKSNKEKTERALSIFEKELSFYSANHLFISTVPDSLSTFQALNSFVNSIKEENDFKNPVVEKLLINALTENIAAINREPIEDEIQLIIDKHIPLSLSKNQNKAIKNAWTNEISYIQGPPGTGKSHTISAIVLSAIALNKKVLVLSQKTAALQVVNKKIDPYLTDIDGLLGICYYDLTARKKIKNYCNFLREETSNSSQFINKNTIIESNLNSLQNKLNLKLKELNSEKSKFEKFLEKERSFKESNEQFLIELKRMNADFFEIPKGFDFKIIRNEEKYTKAIERIDKIWESSINSISTNFYTYRFKQHLKTKFKTPNHWLNENYFPSFVKRFITLNLIYSKVKAKSLELKLDTNSLRKQIRNVKKDIQEIQEKIIRLKYKSNVFSKVNDPSFQREVDKFNGMLTNTNSRIIDKKMKDIDFHKITDVIPFWTAEIRHLGHLFPLIPDLFDLVIVDEASQVNLAEILPAFYRGKKLCIVGDHQQLSLKASGLNFSLGKSFDELTWQKYNRDLMPFQNATKKKLTVTQASILDFIKSDDYNVIPTEIMLDEHFRSLPGLAKYTSKQFYRDEDNPEGKLKIMTETLDKLEIECFQVVKVNGTRDKVAKSKVVLAEAEEVIKIIHSLTSPSLSKSLFENEYQVPNHIDRNSFTIGVISMIRDQCTKIIELIEEKLPNLDAKYELMIGTPEEFQGNERDIMIFSLCLDLDCLKGQGFYQDQKRLNVATSRAKFFTYFVYSPFDRTFNIIYNYLNYIKRGVNEDDFVPQLESTVSKINLPPLDFNKFESDFEKQVYLFLNTFISEYSNGNQITLHNQIQSCGQKRLDFVLYNHTNKKAVAVEVDGSHHFSNNGLAEHYTIEHIERIEILTRAGWNIINTPYHKWYKDGWLSETNNRQFQEEIERIYNEISVAIA